MCSAEVQRLQFDPEEEERKGKREERGREGVPLLLLNSNTAKLTRKFSQKWKVASEQSSSTG